ncbi:redoxin domain-containing protein [Conexibacter sp. CPCC 206217]|uniref:redoxin domain-containing protein n=1 Tax=Conexibacter sp. CPCC 206217 TaxID=3064574 RepID=UPI002726083E|nr:redoxin domain-containing protein [Conexibacter sp. CPCC 206217]MDO8209196.1 redoxin domain-containing protein [Conexibacter sp. CPCC 206217]
MRPPVEAEILAPSFPGLARWVNVATLRMDKQLGRPVLVEFWDFCRVNSLRTIPYLQAWHERYADDGLRVIGIHASGFEASADIDEVRAAVERLGITYPVLIDAELKAAEAYGIEGWPSRYLWDRESRLFDFHFGEGAYADTELAIQELLGVERELVAPVRATDEPGILLPAQTADQFGAWSGPYEAGGVWAVLSGSGVVHANGNEIAVTHPGCYPLIEHEHHTTGVLELRVGDGVSCEAVCFTPGIAPTD